MTRPRRAARQVEPVDGLALFRIAEGIAGADDLAVVIDNLSVEAVRAHVAATLRWGGHVDLYQAAAERGCIDPVWADVAALAFTEMTGSPSHEGVQP